MGERKTSGKKPASIAVILVIAGLTAAGILFFKPGKNPAGQSTDTVDESASVTAGIMKDEEFGGILIDIGIEEFNSHGFDFGDSVNVSFENGETINDIPYYSGYYTAIGELLLCGYPGSENVAVKRSYGDDTWEEFTGPGIDSVTVTLMEKGKYLDIEELYNLTYSDDRNDYESDSIFANFREIEGGKLRNKYFYRSASPCDNLHNRAKYANALSEENNIGFVINMSDSEEKYLSHREKEDFESFYYDSLYNDGKVCVLALTANYMSPEYTEKLSGAFLKMAEEGKPALIHCVEGKDRTGFACTLLLALADASAEEIVKDYMITYDNYYGITEEESPERYDAVKKNVDDFLEFISHTEKGSDLNPGDIKKGAENYLRAGGLSGDEIEKIEKYITGSK